MVLENIPNTIFADTGPALTVCSVCLPLLCLECKFYLEALHWASQRFACRRTGCMDGQCPCMVHYSVGDALAAMLCDPTSYKCANGVCVKCGWDNFESCICPRLYDDELEDEPVSIWKIGKVVRNKYAVEESMQGTVDLGDFLEELEDMMKRYAKHHQAAEHALAEFHACREWLPAGHLLVAMDYAPKFHHEPKRGWQDQIYQQAQTSILVVYVHSRTRKGEPLVTATHFVLSDDAVQDFVKTHAAMLLLKKKGLFRKCKGRGAGGPGEIRSWSR
eukprot:gene3172-7993_t